MKTIRIDGIIGDWNNTTEEFQYRVNELGLEPGEELKVIINSPGGSVFEGFGIYNYLLSLQHKIITEVEGLAASIATLITFAAKKEDTYINHISLFMIHKASTGAHGNSDDLEKQAEILKTIDDTLISVYSARTGKTRKQVEDMLTVETWLGSEDAAKEGFFNKANIINKIDARVAAQAIQSQINKNMTTFKEAYNKYFNKGAEPVVEPVKPTEPVASGEPLKPTEPITPTEPVASGEPVTPEPVKEVVTMEMFNELKAFIEQMAKNSLNQKPIEEQVASAFASQMKAVPGSNGQPRVNQTNLGQNTGDVYVTPHANHRKRMKDIEEKTRVS